ncbi:nucleolin [Rhodamnia argentea]|uniref:Nucleolin n=1 Tax=Rhodamnia argentea TaxID=178133 RepID=A0A8B8NJE8_9MYRT|nr:nucleolin [Rhodamnia argentea]XP_030522613.1 nucleolin [Rhodamnia argentea]XP_030522615.1 nucleolin [Rhodamnia argentea]XP_048139681.1 nucleolin [Rhodamnia argentea]
MRKKRDERGAVDEVDELLRAAQDDVLLKLSLNSHIARSSSDDVDPDLTRRFHALKSRPSAPAAPSHPQPPPRPPASASASSSPSPRQVDAELKAVLGDDLSARFAALRGSLYSSSPSPSSSSSADAAVTVGPSAAADGRDRLDTGELKGRGEDDLKEEDEVEKLIQWAIDAARLDPSPPSDDDDGPNDDDDDDDDHSDDESEQKNKQKSK